MEEKIPTSIHNRLRFVLVETSSPGNVGAVARAIKTMGFTDLWLVRPRFNDVLQQPEAIAFASGAQDVLASARIVDTLSEALTGCTTVAALSARTREFAPPLLSPRQFGEWVQDADETGQCALVFGSERYGLSNTDVMQAQTLIRIPANPDYSSLNLAQAVQLLAYECRSLERDTAAHKPVPGESAVSCQQGAEAVSQSLPEERMKEGLYASAEQIENMYLHLEQALVHIQFLDPAQPGRLMPRIRQMFSRTRLHSEEINILRGLAQQMISHRDRLNRDKK